MEIDINQFYNNQTIIFLEDNFRKELFSKSVEKLGTIKEFKHFLDYKSDNIISAWRTGKINRGDNWITEQGIPLEKLIKICRLNQLDVNSIQNKIICYKSRGKSLKINNPKLPIRISPELFRIIAHMIFDGSALEDNTHYYRNFNKGLLINLKNDLDFVFGNIEITLKETMLILPSIIMKNLMNIFNFRAGTFDSSVPKILFDLPKEYTSYFIQAFFDDEGTVSSDNLRFYSYNNKLISQTKKLLNIKFPNIKTGKLLHRQKDTGMEYSFCICSESIEDYLHDINTNHDSKLSKIQHLIRRKNKEWNHKLPNMTKIEILNSLLERSKTSYELSQNILISPNKITEHLRGYSEKRKINSKGLIELGYVKRLKNGTYNSYTYNLTDKGANYLKSNHKK